MKRTAYQITGQSFDTPGELPKGFTVKAVEVEVDPKDVTVYSAYDKVMRVHVWGPAESQVCFAFGTPEQSSLLFSLDSARQVRDCLNAILGDDSSSPRPVASAPGSDEDQGRVFMYRGDTSPWRWFETKPGLFTYQTSWVKALQESKTGDALCVDESIEQVKGDSEYDVVEVTA